MRFSSFMAVLLVAAAMVVLVFPAPAHSSAPPQTSFPVERFVIDLDLPPQQRWSHVMPTYEGQIQHMFNFVTGFIPSFIRSEVMEAMATVGEALEFFLGVYGLEIQGIADVVGLPAGDIALINILYEMVSMCTSIVAESSDGRILHSRNLDFGLGTEFTTLLQNLTLQVEFQKGGKTVYYGTTYAGYVGLLTGMAPGKFGISLNLRHSGDIMGNVRELLANPGANVVSFLLRRVLETQSDYAAALKRLVTEPLISESYIILSGIASGQGAVITRNRTIAADVWTLGGFQNDSWFLLQTNHDHWLPSPPGDHRTDVGMRAMDAIGPDRISLENLYEVLSTKPLLNAQTTYTTSMAPYNATYTTYMRICPPPCTLHAPLPPPAWTRSRQ